MRTTDFQSAPALEVYEIRNICESPLSSAPSTPPDGALGHKRAGSVSESGRDEYVAVAMKLRQDTRSAPVGGSSLPHTSAKRNATFSPRIIFYDTWPSQEYDRRGELATCNRLTPMLAQQIKEELNTFKMVQIPPSFYSIRSLKSSHIFLLLFWAKKS